MTLFPVLFIYDYIGFVGSAILILALTLAALLDRFAAGGKFLLMNAVGSFLMLFADGFRESYASFGIGLFWIAVSLKALANHNVLDAKSLRIFTGVFTAYAVALLLHTVFLSGYGGSDLVIKIISILLVQAMMLSYIFLVGKRIGLCAYLGVTLAAKVLFLPSLLLDGNSASIVLNAYGVIIAALGLGRLKLWGSPSFLVR